MNIEQYRALKAQEATKAQQPVEQPIVEETISEEQPTPETVEPTKVKVGEEEIDIEELKNGYLRQSDYTKKTQEVSKQKAEAQEAIAFYEHLKRNPDIANELKGSTSIPSRIDPAKSKVMELEEKMYDMMLQQEISTLESKYEDFEVMEVLNMAQAKNLTNLEDAYQLVKSTKGSNPSVTKEQLRKEILAEIKAEGNSTKTIINSKVSDTPTDASLPTLTRQEGKVAGMMGMNEMEYITWRDAGKK